MPRLDGGTPDGHGPPASAASPREFAAYLLRATMANWLVSLLTVAYAFFITPLVIKALDKDLYGVWSFLNGLLDYSNLFYLGLGAAFIKYLSQYRAAGDQRAVNRLASVVLVIYSTIGMMCLLLCIVLAPKIPGLLARPLEPGATHETVVAFMLLGGRLLFMFVATVFSGVLVAEERITTAAQVTIAAIIARFIAVPLLLGHGPPLVTLALITSAISGAQACALAVAVVRSVPALRIRPALPQLSELRILYSFGLKAFFIDLSAWLVNYTDIIVIGLLIGAAGVAEYAIPLQLVTYGRVAVQGMMSALLPRLTAYQTTGDHALLASAYVRVTRITNYVAGFIALNLLALGIPFLQLWVGREFADTSGTVLMLLTLASYCQAVSTQSAVPFYQAMHILRVPVIVLLIEAGANLALSIGLSGPLGVTGVAAATLIPALVITSILLPSHLCRQLQVSLATLLRSAIFPSFCMLVVGVLANLVIDEVLQASSYLMLGIRGVLNIALAAAIAVALLPAEDLASIQRLMRGGRTASG